MKKRHESRDIEADLAKGALVPGVDTSLEDEPSETILNFDPEGESVEYWRVQRFILDPGTIPGVDVNKNVLPVISGSTGSRSIVHIL